MPEKFDRCVDKVKASGSADNPYAVCHTSLDEQESPLDIVLNEAENILTKILDKQKEINEPTPQNAIYNILKEFENDTDPYGITNQVLDHYGLETVAIPSSLSGVSIGGDKKVHETTPYPDIDKMQYELQDVLPSTHDDIINSSDKSYVENSFWNSLDPETKNFYLSQLGVRS